MFKPEYRSSMVANGFLPFLLLLSATSFALPIDQLNIGPDDVLCYVTGSEDTGNGSETSPYNSLADVENDANCTIILIIPYNVDNAVLSNTVLDRGITLKDGQSLYGLGPDVTVGTLKKKRPYITNTFEEDYVDPQPYTATAGIGVILADDNEVAGLHIDSTFNAAISGANVNGAHIHNMLITNAVTSGDLALAPPFPTVEAGAIEIVNAPWVPSRPPVNADYFISDTIISEGFSAFSVGSELIDVSLMLDNVTVKDLSRKNTPTEPVTVLTLVSLNTHLTLTINNSRFLNIDNSGNFYPAIFPRVFGDQNVFEFTVTNSIFENPSAVGDLPFGDFGLIARGDAININAVGGFTKVSFTDFIIRNAGQEAIELVTGFLDSPPFSTRSSELEVSLKRVSITGAGRIALLGKNFFQSGGIPDGVDGPSQQVKVEDSTFANNGVLVPDDFPFGFPRGDAIVFLGHPVDPGVFVLDFGGGLLGSSGGNRIFGNTMGPETRDIRLDGLDGIVVSAHNNWWGTSEGLDIASRVDLSTSFNGTTVEALNPLKKDPTPQLQRNE